MTEPAKILIVDDDPHIRRILQFLLEDAGYDVVAATDGRQALDLLSKHQPDLLLLDLMMPHMDGFAVLERIRQSRESRRLPVIMLTAHDRCCTRVKGLRGGANDYVTKPFDQEELLARVSNMLETSQSQREANPLTGLPGNLAIEREVQRRLTGGDAFGAMYVDIDHFKGFNDHYGYARGDRAISFLAHVLCGTVDQLGDPGDFVGHIGGDDFLVVCESARAEAIARAVVDGFDAGVPALHDAEDLEAGYLQSQTRTGEIARIPLISLTIALIAEAAGRFSHHAAMSDALAELKAHGKRQRGSVVVIERRSRGSDAVPQCLGRDILDRES
jgi:PleD family two-component response regulator